MRGKWIQFNLFDKQLYLVIFSSYFYSHSSFAETFNPKLVWFKYGKTRSLSLWLLTFCCLFYCHYKIIYTRHKRKEKGDNCYLCINIIIITSFILHNTLAYGIHTQFLILFRQDFILFFLTRYNNFFLQWKNKQHLSNCILSSSTNICCPN